MMIPKREYQKFVSVSSKQLCHMFTLSNCKILFTWFSFTHYVKNVLFIVLVWLSVSLVFLFLFWMIELFTNRRRCLAFFVRSVQSNLVASICSCQESRTNRSRDELRSNRFHRSHHSGLFFGHCSTVVGLMSHRWPMMRRHAFANIVDNFESLERMVLVYSLLLTHCNHLDRRFQQQAY